MFIRTLIYAACFAVWSWLAGHPASIQMLVVFCVSMLFLQWSINSLRKLWGPVIIVSERELETALRVACEWLTLAEIADKIWIARRECYLQEGTNTLREPEIRKSLYPIPIAVQAALRQLESRGRLEKRDHLQEGQLLNEDRELEYRLRIDRLWA